jgi:hypothetical protein
MCGGRPKTEGTNVSTTIERNMVLVAATAISAVGLLNLSAPAYADPIPVPPNCNNHFLFSTVDVDITQDNGIDVFPATDQGGTNIAGPAYYLAGPARAKTTGSVVGGMNENFIDFTANWDNGGSNHYTGQINPDGSMSGTTLNNKNVKNNWNSGRGSLKCAPVAPVAAAAPVNPVNPPPVVPPPTATATVNKSDDIYNLPDGNGTPYLDANGHNIFKSPGQVQLVSPDLCRQDWCHVVAPEVQGQAWIYAGEGFMTVQG